MAGRYTRVFTAKNNLYALGSPVIMSAGALLKDNQTGKILAQLKIRSIANKKIKALTLNVSSFDTSGAALDEDVSFEYLDLSAARDEEFGQKTLIPLPNASTRAFDVTVTKVIFKDNDIWENDQKFSLTVPEPTSLAAVLQDNELVKQYTMHFNQAVAKPKKVHDLWYCACGALNHREEAVCPKCKNKLESLVACDFDALKSECDERLAKEKAEREEADRIAHEKAVKNTKRTILAICAVIAVVLLITKVIVPNSKYNAAIALMDEGKYEEAIAAFETMNGYKDSVEQITACETGIKDDAYDAAVALMNEGKYEEAIEAFEAMNGYRDSAEMITACETGIKDDAYDAAIALMSEGNIIEAYESLIAMDGYKDSAEKAESIFGEYITKKLEHVHIGDYITFGAYEQDNNKSNGKENIEWLVLAKEDNKVLVISRYALDCRPYNTKYKNVTWETCTQRTWLNETFLNEAFIEADQSIIQTTEVSADRNPDYSTDPGNATKDKIFLLSIDEANKYFTSDEARMCVPTAYAIANGAWTGSYNVDGKSTCWWWLRSPGLHRSLAAHVNFDGGVSSLGHSVLDDCDCVRPALWINLDA